MVLQRKSSFPFLQRWFCLDRMKTSLSSLISFPLCNFVLSLFFPAQLLLPSRFLLQLKMVAVSRRCNPLSLQIYKTSIKCSASLHFFFFSYHAIFTTTNCNWPTWDLTRSLTSVSFHNTASHLLSTSLLFFIETENPSLCSSNPMMHYSRSILSCFPFCYCNPFFLFCEKQEGKRKRKKERKGLLC